MGLLIRVGLALLSALLYLPLMAVFILPLRAEVADTCMLSTGLICPQQNVLFYNTISIYKPGTTAPRPTSPTSAWARLTAARAIPSALIIIPYRDGALSP